MSQKRLIIIYVLLQPARCCYFAFFLLLLLSIFQDTNMHFLLSREKNLFVWSRKKRDGERKEMKNEPFEEIDPSAKNTTFFLFYYQSTISRIEVEKRKK